VLGIPDSLHERVTLCVVSYQINARTELAIRYNDISPLENHHCAVAFQILSNPETNIFANVDMATFKRIRAVRSHHCRIDNYKPRMHCIALKEFKISNQELLLQC